MKKIVKILILAAMIVSLYLVPAVAGDTNFSKYGVTNYNGTRIFRALTTAPNKKATRNADWYYKVNTIQFTMDTSGTLGMAFTPMKYMEEDYYTVGADVGWALSSTGVKYKGWNGNGFENITYYLGLRLDDLLTSGSGSVSGYWNAY